MHKQTSTPARSSKPPASIATINRAAPERFGEDNQWNQEQMSSAQDAPASMFEEEGGVLGAFAMGGALLGPVGPPAADDPSAGDADSNSWMVDFGRTGSVPRAGGTTFDDDSDLNYDEKNVWQDGTGEQTFGRKDAKALAKKAVAAAKKHHAARKKAAGRKRQLKDAAAYMSDDELKDLKEQWEFDDFLDESKAEANKPRKKLDDDTEPEKKRGSTYREQLESLGITKDSASFGAFRDESQIDVTEFMDDRSRANFSGAASGSVTSTATTADGTVHSTTKHQARAGASVGDSHKSTFIDGSARTDQAISADIAADAVVDATSGTYEVAGGAGARADVSGRAGVSGEASGGIKRTVDLGGRVSGNTEVGGSIDGFIGVEGDVGAQAEATRGKATARAGAEVSAGARIAGKGAAQASLNAGKTRIVGARAEAEGDAFAGVKGGVDTSAVACIKEGVKAEAGGEVLAGATAKGNASAGVTLGGVDADIVGEGEAFAGAKAKAKGEIAFGPKGGEVAVGGEAFAGARAEGSVGVVLGAAGLSLGEVKVTGKVKAGAGGHFNLNVKAQDGELKGEVGAAGAVGVGAGMSVAVKGDALFIPRLVIDQVVKNGPAVAADSGSVNMGGCGWVVRPGSGAADHGETAAVAGETPLVDLLGSLDEDAAQPYIAFREFGDETIEGAYESVGVTANEAVSSGLTLFGRLGPAIVAKFVEAESAHAEAWQAIEQLMVAAGSHAGTILGKLGEIGGLALAELGALVATPIWDLLDRDFEGEVDALLTRIEILILNVRAVIEQMIEATRDAVLDVGAKAGRAIMLPIRNIANTAGGVVGEMGMDFVGAGIDISDTLVDAFTPAEEGIEVEGTGTEIFLPHAVTPSLAPGRGALSDGKAFFEGASQGSFGKVIEEVAGPILTTVLVDAPVKLVDWAQSLLTTFDETFAAVWQPIRSTVQTVATFVAPAVNGLRSFLLSLGIGGSREEKPAPDVPVAPTAPLPDPAAPPAAISAANPAANNSAAGAKSARGSTSARG
jgi:hypothetical protein